MKLNSYQRKEMLALCCEHVYFHIFTQNCICHCNVFGPSGSWRGARARDCCLWLEIHEQEGHALSNTHTHAIRFANDPTFAQ